MPTHYYSYLTFAPSQITGICVIERKKGNILDQISRILTVEKMIKDGQRILL